MRPSTDSSRPGLLVLTPEVQAVVRLCRDNGAVPIIVGVAVRDALLAGLGNAAHAPKDVDIELHDVRDVHHIVEVLSTVGDAQQQGVSFPVISLRIGDQYLDLNVAKSSNRAASLARRDFTINALAWDPESGELYDFFDGVADLRSGILRHTSSHYAEDPLRVLRGVQLAGRLGFQLAPETAVINRQLSPAFDHLPIEPVWGEWRKLARRATHWPEALAALYESGWAPHFPELLATRGIPQDPRWHAEGDVWTHLGLSAQCAAIAARNLQIQPEEREVAVLGALVHDFGKATHTEEGELGITSRGHAAAGVAPAQSFLTRIGAPRSITEKILPLVAEHMAHVSVEGRPSTIAVRRLIRRLHGGGHGPSIEDWARVVDADCAGRGESARESPASLWLEVAARVGNESTTSLLTGRHLIDRGLAPGPQFAAILGAALKAQDDEVFSDETGAIAWLRGELEGRT